METNKKKLTQLDFFTDFNGRIDAIEERRTFDDILARVGSRKFGRADLLSYNRQLQDLNEKARLAHSNLKNYIHALGTFKREESIDVLAKEAGENLKNDLFEFLLIVKEMLNGKESEGKILPFDKRKSRTK